MSISAGPERKRTQTDKLYDQVDGNKAKFQWKALDRENGLHLIINGCNNEKYYIIKEDTRNDVIIRLVECSSNHNMKILSRIDPNHTPCWKAIANDGTLPKGAFRVHTGSKNIYIGKHSDITKGVARVELLRDGEIRKWQFVSENGKNEISGFEILCNNE